MKAIKQSLYLFSLVTLVTFFSSCKKDEPSLTASVYVVPLTTSTDLDGDIAGDGGSTTKTLSWSNTRTTADYSMDLSSSQGSFRMVIKDAAGTLILDNTLEKGKTADSKSGVTAAGTPGTWTVDIILSSFNGKGDFSLSEGN